MLHTIKHIRDDIFFFQEDSAQLHCVCNTIQLSEICDFRVFLFCQVVQKHKLFEVAYKSIFIGNISAKKIKIHSCASKL